MWLGLCWYSVLLFFARYLYEYTCLLNSSLVSVMVKILWYGRDFKVYANDFIHETTTEKYMYISIQHTEANILYRVFSNLCIERIKKKKRFFKFHRGLLPRAKLTIMQHLLRQCRGIERLKCAQTYTGTYTLPGLNDLRSIAVVSTADLNCDNSSRPQWVDHIAIGFGHMLVSLCLGVRLYFIVNLWSQLSMI